MRAKFLPLQAHELTVTCPVRCTAALSAKLGEELKFETDSADPTAEPEFLQAFKSEGVWEVCRRPVLRPDEC